MIQKEDTAVYWIEFVVKDTGIGIAPDKIQTVFERFTQAESHTTRNYGGTGLGLSIAKQLVELQGGTIAIESNLGVGSEFKFALPFKKTDQAFTKNSSRQKTDMESLDGIKILLVEDNAINIKFIQSLFADHHLTADLAMNGIQALQKIKQNTYDVVLMDIEMPELNGYETTRIIRNDFKNKVPIIAMTAHAMSGEREKCLQLGMNDYLSKPIDTDALFQKMSALTKSGVQQKEEDATQNPELSNLAFLEKTMRGNKESILEIIDLFLEQTPTDLEIIAQGIADTNYNMIRSRTHSFKSSVGILGMTGLSALLQEMESLAKSETGIETIISLNSRLSEICSRAIKELQVKRVNYLPM